MASADEFGLNIALNIQDNVSKRLDKIEETITNVAEVAEKINMKTLSNEAREASKELKATQQSAYRMNKALEFSRAIARDIGVDNSFEEVVQTIAQIVGVSEEVAEKYANIGKLINDNQESSKDWRDSEKDFYAQLRMYSDDLSKSEKERSKTGQALGIIIKGTTSSMGELVGLGSEVNKGLNATKVTMTVLNKLFLDRFKDRKLKAKKQFKIEQKQQEMLSNLRTMDERAADKIAKKIYKEKLRRQKLLGKGYSNEAKLAKTASSAGASGAGGGGGGQLMQFMGGGGGAASAAMTSATVGLTAAIAGLAVVVGVIAGALALLYKALTLSSGIMEEFHTANYRAAGGMDALTDTVSIAVGKHQILMDEAKNATKALADMGITMKVVNDNIDKAILEYSELVAVVAQFTRITGVSEKSVAKMMKTTRGLGGAQLQINETLDIVISSMEKYNFTVEEASKLMDDAIDVAFEMSVVMGRNGESINTAAGFMSKLGAISKQMTGSADAGIDLFKDLTKNVEKFIVLTSGASLKDNISGMEALLKNVGGLNEMLENAPDAYTRQILLEVHGITAEQVRLLEETRKAHESWIKEQTANDKEAVDMSKLTLENWAKSSDDAVATSARIQSMAEESNQNIERQMSLLRDKFFSILTRFGTLLMPVFSFAADQMVRAAEALYNFIFEEAISFGDVTKGVNDATTVLKDYNQEQLNAIEVQKAQRKVNEEVTSLERRMATLSAEEKKKEYQRIEELQKDAKQKADNLNKVVEDSVSNNIKQNETNLKALDKRMANPKLKSWIEDIKDAAVMLYKAGKVLWDVAKWAAENLPIGPLGMTADEMVDSISKSKEEGSGTLETVGNFIKDAVLGGGVGISPFNVIGSMFSSGDDDDDEQPSTAEAIATNRILSNLIPTGLPTTSQGTRASYSIRNEQESIKFPEFDTKTLADSLDRLNKTSEKSANTLDKIATDKSVGGGSAGSGIQWS